MVEYFHDKERGILVYPLMRGDVFGYLPEAKPLPSLNGSRYFAVPHNLANAQFLAKWNFPVPPIIGDDYDWPCQPGITPYESQRTTANFLVLNPRSFCFSDMGSGKTLAALWAADWLMRHHPQGTFRALIVCPLSIMERVWGDAISRNFLHNRRFEVLYGSHQKRQATLEKTKADFLIVNFDGVGVGAHTSRKIELGGFSQLLAQSDRIQLGIIDEASAYRDARTKRHRIARAIFATRKYLWLLTGTPTPNAPTDAYGIAKLVNNAYGKSFTTFQLETMWKVSQFKWVPQKDGYEKARRLMAPSIRFDITDVWDGPELTTQQRQVELTEQQKKLAKELKRDLMLTMASGEVITAAHEAALRIKFLQISQGAIYDHRHVTHEIDASSRIEELQAVLEEAPGKVLVFSGLTSVLNMLYKKLDKWSRELVNGEVSAKARAQIFSRFQSEGEPRILLADPGTMAHGLDLWQARTVVWYGPTDKTELYAQANKRAHRPGQRFPVTVVQLVSSQLEREIFRRLESNLSLQGALLDAVARDEI